MIFLQCKKGEEEWRKDINVWLLRVKSTQEYTLLYVHYMAKRTDSYNLKKKVQIVLVAFDY